MRWKYVNACGAYLVEVCHAHVTCGSSFRLPLSLYIWGCMCSTDPFQFRWLKGYIHSSCYYHHRIGSINLTHCYHIFPGLCAWDVCSIIFCHVLHIRSGKTGNLISILLCSFWWVQIIGYVLAGRSCSFVCTLLLSSLCKLIWRHWTYKMPVRYICWACE